MNLVILFSDKSAVNFSDIGIRQKVGRDFSDKKGKPLLGCYPQTRFGVTKIELQSRFFLDRKAVNCIAERAENATKQR